MELLIRRIGVLLCKPYIIFRSVVDQNPRCLKMITCTYGFDLGVEIPKPYFDIKLSSQFFFISMTNKLYFLLDFFSQAMLPNFIGNKPLYSTEFLQY